MSHIRGQDVILLAGEQSYFHQARLQYYQPGSHFTSWTGKTETGLLVLSLLIDATTGLSAGYGTNQCVHSHKNIFDELRWSKLLNII